MVAMYSVATQKSQTDTHQLHQMHAHDVTNGYTFGKKKEEHTHFQSKSGDSYTSVTQCIFCVKCQVLVLLVCRLIENSKIELRII